MLRNTVFRLRIVQKWGVLSSSVWFAVDQKSRFGPAIRWDMGSAVIKGIRFADSQELCFEAWKRSYNACSAHLCGQFSDSQKSRFQASKRTNMGSAHLVGGRFDFRNSFFKLQNVQIWTVPNCKWSICCLTGMAFSGCETFRYEQYHPARESIC